MSRSTKYLRASLVALGLLALCLTTNRAANAQLIQRSIGGVFIGPDGLVKNLERDDLGKLRREREAALHPVSSELGSTAALRKVSLRRLDAAIAEHQKTGAPLPDEMRYLAGMQRVQYIFIYPEQHDIVLAGPGEGWRVNDEGEVVGVKSGRPVLLLDDLLVSLRLGESDLKTGMTCSIDPTAEGIRRFYTLIGKIGGAERNPQAEEAAISEAMGPQTVTLAGLPTDSHFASVMVIADYKMKRLAMGFDPSPVAGIPSYFELLKSPKTKGGAQPRWWLEPNYGAMLVSPDAMAWEIRGPGVKALTEDELISRDGKRKGSGVTSPAAKKWADSMTSHYDDLCAKQAIFGQLRNCIDMSLVAALIYRERLMEKTDCKLPTLTNATGLPSEKFNTPSQTPTISSVFQMGAKWVVTASGGIRFNRWMLLQKQEQSGDLTPIREKSLADAKTWWWD